MKWFSSSKRVFFVLLAITTVVCFGVLNIEAGSKVNTSNDIFTVEFDYYGMDSTKIEQLITIPLEEKMMGLEGLLELNSSVEYGKTTCTAFVKKSKHPEQTYLALRTITDTLYQTLPQDVQKPRIYSSENGSKNVMSIAFYEGRNAYSLRDTIESTLKKQLEAVDGVAEVIVTGGIQKEVLVAVQPEKSAALLQNPENFVSVIQDSNIISPGSEFLKSDRSFKINFDTRLNSINEISDLTVRTGDSYTKLGAVADVSFSAREKQEIVRIDGEEVISVNIKASSSGNQIKVSNSVRKILVDYKTVNPDFKILYDEGEKQLKLIKKVFLSLIESFICILIVIPVFYKVRRTVFLLPVFIVLTSLWTVGILYYLGMSIDQNTIAGLSIALGLISDPALVIAENAENSSSKKQFIKQFKSIIPSIVSGCFTTVLVLIPLFFMESIVPGTKIIAVTVSIMVVSSVILAVFFFSAFIYSSKSINYGQKEWIIKINRFLVRYVFLFSKGTLCKNKVGISCYFMLLISPLFLFVFADKNLMMTHTSNIIFCSADYSSDTSCSYIDNELLKISKALSSNDFIEFVRIESRKGSADIEVGYKNKSRKEVTTYLSGLAAFVPDCFFYVPEASSKDKKERNINSFKIAFAGDETSVCRDLCEQSSIILGKSPFCRNIIYNFKNAESEYLFLPDEGLLAKNALNTRSIASTLRWYMFGPVADKIILDGKEYDVRVAGNNLRNSTIEDISNLHIPLKTSAIRLITLGKLLFREGAGKIYRKDGRRCLYITVEISGLSTDKAVDHIKNNLRGLNMPKGYTYSFSREIEEMSENFRHMYFVLFASIVGIFLLLMTLTENLKKTLLMISIIPVSISIPLMIKYFLGVPLELGDVIGMVLLSGISVNNSILILESRKSCTAFKIREKLKSIMATSLTTIVGAVPLFFAATDSFSKSLSFFMFAGILSSTIICFVLFPGVIDYFTGKQIKFHR